MKIIIKVVTVAFALFIVWFVWDSFIKDKTPMFFPINEPRGQYSIIKYPNDIFEVKYVGPNTFNQDATVSIIVGKTNYDLNKYLGKKVFITKGEFVSGYKQQCISNSCKDIGGPHAVINVDELLEMK